MEDVYAIYRKNGGHMDESIWYNRGYAFTDKLRGNNDYEEIYTKSRKNGHVDEQVFFNELDKYRDKKYRLSRSVDRREYARICRILEEKDFKCI